MRLLPLCYTQYRVPVKLKLIIMTTVRQQAISDIKEDLRQHSKCFLAFHKNLNPVMDNMVNNYIKLQEQCHVAPPANMQYTPKTNACLVARCTFCQATSKAEYENYSKYYAPMKKSNNSFIPQHTA